VYEGTRQRFLRDQPATLLFNATSWHSLPSLISDLHQSLAASAAQREAQLRQPLTGPGAVSAAAAAASQHLQHQAVGQQGQAGQQQQPRVKYQQLQDDPRIPYEGHSSGVSSGSGTSSASGTLQGPGSLHAGATTSKLPSATTSSSSHHAKQGSAASAAAAAAGAQPEVQPEARGPRLRLTSHPLPLTLAEGDAVDCFLTVLAAVFVLVPFCYLAGAYASAPVAERRCGGAEGLLAWLASPGWLAVEHGGWMACCKVLRLACS
jgi:hypothetical protein